MAKPNSKAPLGQGDAAWLAGFLDGEGTFGLCNRSARKGEKRPYWEPVVSVVNTDLPVILWIQDRCGGSLWDSRGAPSRRATHKTAYHLRWSDAQALVLIDQVLPYLKIKQRQAAVVREFILHRQSTPSPGRRGHSVEVVAIRRALAEEVQALNRRGVA